MAPDGMDIDVNMTTTAPTSLSSSSPLPPLQVTSVKEASHIATLLHQQLAPLIQKARSTDNLRASVDNISLFYQKKISKALSSQTPTATPTTTSEQQQQIEELHNQIEQLREQLPRAEADISTLRLENTTLLTRLSDRDTTIASTSAELSRLRPEALSATSLRTRAAERDALRDQLSHETNRRHVLESSHSAAQNALHDQVSKLTAQLARTRCDASAAIGARDSAEREAEKIVRQAEQRVSEESERKRKMQTVVDRLERELNDTRAAAVELESSFKAEVDHLKSMCELHDSRAKEAEQRASDCEEVLKQERELSDMKRKKREEEIRQSKDLVGTANGRNDNKEGLAPHVKTLLSDMEHALETRWGLMERQKEEVDRARREEMKAVAKCEKLQRDLKDIRSRADSARRDALRYVKQIETQAETIARMERDALEASRTNGQLSNQVSSLGGGAGMGVGRLSAPVGHGPALVTPLRNSGGLVGETPVGFGASAFGLRMRPSWPPPHPSGIVPTSTMTGTAQQLQQEVPPASSPMMMDIGPHSVIPTNYFASPSQMQNMPAELASTLREMSEVRRRQERLLESLRDNRLRLSGTFE